MPELRVRELVDSAAPKHGKVPPHLRGLTRKLQNKIKKTKHRKVPPHLRAHAKDTKKIKKKTQNSNPTPAGSRGSSEKM